MTEEPYRWLEAMDNRREYVLEQLRPGSPVLGCSTEEGIVLVTVNSGQSKIFEIFDRHMAAALGHPADIEKLRQSLIDMAHLEAFTRSSEDVTIRRLVGFGLSPAIKTSFEQLYAAPVLAEWLFAELGRTPVQDVLMRLHFHGGFEPVEGGVSVVAAVPEREKQASEWLRNARVRELSLTAAVDHLLQAWWMLVSQQSLTEEVPDETKRSEGWRNALKEPGRSVEIGFLDRKSRRNCRAGWKTLEQLGL